jgi:hypothetical protein
MRITKLLLALGLLSFGMASCSTMDSPVASSEAVMGLKATTTKSNSKKTGTTAQVVSGTGTVHKFASTSFPGTYYYGIETDAGVRYEAVNFPSGAFTDGQRVNFSGYLVTAATTNNYGQAIVLSAITAA